MKKFFLFLVIVLAGFAASAKTAETIHTTALTEASISESKPKPGFNKSKRAKQVKKMKSKAAKSHRRSGGDLTRFNCGG